MVRVYPLRATAPCGNAGRVMSGDRMDPAESDRQSVTPHAQGRVINLTAVPRSRANRVEIDTGEAIRVRITAAPVDGAANARLLKYLATILDVPSSALSVISGTQARHKRVLARGIDNTSAWSALCRAAEL